MTVHALRLMTFGHTESKKGNHPFGAVNFDKVAAFTNLRGQSVRCLSGYLWLTLENDPTDHVIHPGQAIEVASKGKVVVGGKGRYALEPVTAQDMVR